MARGMVVGESIVSQANTSEFEDGYDRTFGEREPQRGTWRVDAAGNLVEIGADWMPSHANDRVPVVSDLYMDGVRAVDGADIGSRAKRRAYMAAKGYADADDFKGEWSRKESERERIKSGDADTAERREQIGRALHEIKRR